MLNSFKSPTGNAILPEKKDIVKSKIDYAIFTNKELTRYDSKPENPLNTNKNS